MDFQETLYCHCRGPDLGKRMKQCNRCLDWFHEDCESFDDVDQNFFPNHWFDRHCIGIHLLPRKILEVIFLKLCKQEEMHLILLLVWKRWSEIVNRNFRDRAHIAWLNREFNATNWIEEIKQTYRVPFTVLKCLNCNRSLSQKLVPGVIHEAALQYMVQITIFLSIAPKVKLLVVHRDSKC